MASGTTANIPQQGVNAAPASAAQRARPFCQASKWGCEQGNAVSYTQGASAQTFGPSPLPATGYIQRIPREEELLRRELGEPYSEYASQRRRLVPGLY